MQTFNYTEQDIQDYASGSYEGDVLAFEKYLQQNAAAMEQVNEYRELFSIMQSEPIPALSFNLADSVLSKTHQPASSRSLSYALIIIGAAAAIITLKNFFTSAINIGLLTTASIIMIAFLAACYHIETNITTRLQKKMFER